MNQALKKLTKAIHDKLFHINMNINFIHPSKDLIKSLIAKTCPSCIDNSSFDQLKLVVFDTETTGFDCSVGDEIISISGVKIENGKLTDQVFDSLVNPHRAIPAQITELTGITEEMVAKKPDIFCVLNEFLSFAGDSVLVAHHAGFDLSFINYKLKKFCQVELKLPVLDTCLLSRELLPDLPSHNLDSLIEYFNLPDVGRHTSLGDSLITAQLFQNLLNIMHHRKIYTLPDLYSFLYARGQLTSLQG